MKFQSQTKGIKFIVRHRVVLLYFLSSVSLCTKFWMGFCMNSSNFQVNVIKCAAIYDGNESGYRVVCDAYPLELSFMEIEFSILYQNPS